MVETAQPNILLWSDLDRVTPMHTKVYIEINILMLYILPSPDIAMLLL